MMQVKPTIVTLSTGEQKALADLYAEKPLALVFLRHFGCIFCREQVAELRAHPDWNVAFVTMGDVVGAADFKVLMKSPHTFLCDPDAKLYEEFGLERGSVKQMFSGEVWARGFQAARKGHTVGRPVGDPWRMPGEFVIDTSGTVVWEHRPRHAGESATTSQIEAALKKAAKAAAV